MLVRISCLIIVYTEKIHPPPSLTFTGPLITSILCTVFIINDC